MVDVIKGFYSKIAENKNEQDIKNSLVAEEKKGEHLIDTTKMNKIIPVLAIIQMVWE